MLELNASNYQQEVIDKSHRLPVLVDFWADWCAPCKMIAPVLENLAAEYGEQLQIGKVDTEQERELAAEHAIRSLPTLRLYRNGAVVEEVLGVQPEATLRALIDAYLVRASDSALSQALELAAGGDRPQAIALLQAAADDDPANTNLPLPLVRLYMQARQPDKAAQLLDTLPRDVRDSDEGTSLRRLMEFAAAAAAAPAVNDLRQTLESQAGHAQARYQLASLELLDGDYGAALENFMTLLKTSKDYGDGAAQRGLLAVFGLLGEDDERVAAYRRQMFNILH